MKKLGFIGVVLFCLQFCYAFNVHREIASLQPYYTELDELSNLLKANPKAFDKKYNELIVSSKKEGNDNLFTVLYILNGSHYYYQRNLDSSRYYFDKAIDLSKKSKQTILQRTATIRRIFCDEFEKSALEQNRLMEEQYHKSLKNRDTINMIYSLNGMGLFYSKLDSTELAMKQYYKGLKLAEKTNNLYEQGFILNNLGLMKLELTMLDDAAKDFKQGLKLADELNNIILEGHLRQNLGYYYLLSDSINQAEDNYYVVREMGADNNYPSLILSSLVNLGALERIRGNDKISEEFYSSALKLAYAENFYHAISHIYMGKAQSLIKQKDYKSALSFLDSAIVYENYTSASEIRQAYYQFKSKVLERQQKYSEALEVYKKYKSLTDSLNEAGNIQKMAELQFRYYDEKKEKQRLEEKNKYEIELKESKLKAQKSELEASTYRQNFIFIIIVLFIIGGGILIYHYRSMHKKNEQFSMALAEKLEEERSRIARDLHDGLGQNLIILKNKFLLSKNGNPSLTSEIDDEFSDVIEEVRTISRTLLPPELKRLGLKKAILNMLKNIERTTDIHINHDISEIDDIALNEQKSVRIYRIVQELLTNTVKHAGATAIKLETSINHNDLKIVYQDNGSSFDLEKWKASDNSVGLRSIMQRLSYLKGTIKFDKPKNGFKVIIQIKTTQK